MSLNGGISSSLYLRPCKPLGSSYCGRDEKQAFSPRTFREVCEDCKSGPCNRGTEFPIRDTEMNSLATRSPVAECRARASPLRCRIRDLLEPKSRIKRIIRKSCSGGEIDDKDIVCAGHSHHA